MSALGKNLLLPLQQSQDVFTMAQTRKAITIRLVAKAPHSRKRTVLSFCESHLLATKTLKKQNIKLENSDE